VYCKTGLKVLMESRGDTNVMGFSRVSIMM